MPNLFIIAGCNGAGKTTASFTVLPDMLQIREFVNADEIARGLSPFQPEKVAIEAGRIMLKRLEDLLLSGADFAFETTLATKSFVGMVRRARKAGYTVTLVYFWLNSVRLAESRVQTRVAEGGHNIPLDTIARRYYAGIRNFLWLYKPEVDFWILIDNSNKPTELIARSDAPDSILISSYEKWTTFNQQATNDAIGNHE